MSKSDLCEANLSTPDRTRTRIPIDMPTREVHISAVKEMKNHLRTSGKDDLDLAGWLSKARIELQEVRKSTDECLKKFLELLKELKFCQIEFDCFALCENGLEVSRSCLDGDVSRALDEIKDGPESLRNARRECGFERMKLLIQAQRFNLVGVVQLFELEHQGYADFKFAIPAECRKTREEVWTALLVLDRYAELSSALTTWSRLDHSGEMSIPEIIADAVAHYADHAGKNKSKLANEEEPDSFTLYCGEIFIDENAVPRRSAFMLHVICQWLGVLSAVGTFEEAGKFLLDPSYGIFDPFWKVATAVENWNEDVIFDPSYMQKMLTTMHFKKCDPDGKMAPKFAEFCKLAAIEGQVSLDTYWPLYRVSETFKTREEDYKAAAKNLKNWER